MLTRQRTDFNAILKNLTSIQFEYNLSHIGLLRGSLNTHALQHQCFRTVNFEKGLCRSAFRKQFGLKQCAANLYTAFALTHMSHGGFLAEEQKRKQKQKQTDLSFENLLGPKRETGKLNPIASKSKDVLKNLHNNEIQVINVHWATEQLVRNIEQKQNIKPVIYNFIRDVKTLLRLWRSVSALKGVKVMVKGRLSRKKKSLSQYAHFNAGVVPLSTVKAKIDFNQRVIKTKFGSLSLKLWLCYG